MVKHTMSMYATKDAMIEAMQAEIDSLEAQLAEARKDSERLGFMIGARCYCGFDIGSNNKVVSILYWAGGVDEIARGKTPREAIDNAMLNGYYSSLRK